MTSHGVQAGLQVGVRVWDPVGCTCQDSGEGWQLDALSHGLLAEELSSIDVQHREEQTAAEQAISGPATQSHGDPVDDSKVDLTVDFIQLNGTRVDIRLDALPGKSGILSSQHFRKRARRNLAANVVFSEHGQPDGPQSAVGTHCTGTVAGKH